MKILVCGFPGSGKTTLSKSLCEIIDAVHLDANSIRKEYTDIDYSSEGVKNEVSRLRYLADGVVRANKIAVIDYVAPTNKIKKELGANYIVWIDIKKEIVRDFFESPTVYNYRISKWFNDTHLQLADIIKKYKLKNGH